MHYFPRNPYSRAYREDQALERALANIPLPVPRDDPINPRNPYSREYRAMEQLERAMANVDIPEPNNVGVQEINPLIGRTRRRRNQVVALFHQQNDDVIEEFLQHIMNNHPDAWEEIALLDVAIGAELIGLLWELATS